MIPITLVNVLTWHTWQSWHWLTMRQKHCLEIKEEKWPVNLFFLLLSNTDNWEAINHRTKAEIKLSSSICIPFPPECKRKLREPFVQVTRVLRNGFMLTYSSGTRYPECASSIHTKFPQDLVGASQQILYFNIRPIQAGEVGHEAWLLQSERDILGITSRLEFMITTPRGGVTQRRVYCFISQCASRNPCLRQCQGIYKKKRVTLGCMDSFTISMTNYLTAANVVWLPFNLHTNKAYWTVSGTNWNSITT